MRNKDEIHKLNKQIQKLKEDILTLQIENQFNTYIELGFSHDQAQQFIKEDQEALQKAHLFKEQFNHEQAHFFGYPGNLTNDSSTVRQLRELETELFYVNNAGDPFERGHNHFDGKAYEQELLHLFFKRFSLNPETSWGYISSGGSESNEWAIRSAYDKYEKARFYFSKAAHYSIEKTLRLAHKGLYPYTVIDVISSTHEAIDVDKLIAEIQKNYSLKQEVPLLLLTWGTTKLGSVDDVEQITRRLNDLKIPYYCHVDAAFFGGIPPHLKDAPICPNLDTLHADSISISFHKFFGVPQINSIVLSKHKADGHYVSYIAHRDTTVSGSRSFAIFSATQRIKEVFERTPADWYAKNVEWMIKALNEANIPYHRDGLSNIFVIAKPSDKVLRKYHLSSFEGKKYPDSCAHFIINPFHTIDDLQQLIYDLKEDVKNNPQILDL